MENKSTEKWIFLSYPLNPATPAYGNGTPLKITPVNQIINGDSCNTASWSLPNHLGTHMDFPYHFFLNGKTLSSYPADYFVYERVGCMDLSPVHPGKIIGPEDMDISKVDQDIELLLIKTGFCELRNQKVYWEQNPGFHPELAEYLRLKLSKLRAVGFDSISLSSFSNRTLGRQAHKSFLGGDHPLLPIEDMNLKDIDSSIIINSVIATPLPVENADGSPCSVLANIKWKE